MPNHDLKQLVDALLALHRPGNPVVLPTRWDAWSANLAVGAGLAALTVGSHPVADSVGRADNEGMTFDELLTRLAQITGAVDVPVSVDIESGYGEAPTRLIEGLLGVGAVDGAGVHVVVNARTDLFLRKDGDDADRVDRAVARLKEAAEAGATIRTRSAA